MIEPRGWQIRALEKFLVHRPLSFLLEATPGAGKTMFSAFCAQKLIERGQVDFSLVIVPTTALKGDSDAGFIGDWNKIGIQLTPVLKDGRGHPTDFDGGVINYQQLPNFISTVETWARRGVRLFVVLDEIHHATDANVWGTSVERLARCVETAGGKILGMTGTPFRGDGRRISFCEYDEEQEIVKPDAFYKYREAVRDKVCREVQFITDDGFAEYIRDEMEHEIKLSEAKTEEHQSDSAKAIYRADSPWLRAVIEKADACLDEYRAWDADAGGLIVCRPGTDDNDDRHLLQVAKMVREVTGEEPEVICHKDNKDNDAAAKIARFRRGTSRWICAVRMISEGVDIKRLRVEVMANRPTTELLFRQLVGRVIRVDDKSRPGDATVYIAKFPQLSEWASRISEEAKAGLRDLDKEPKTNGEGGDRLPSSFAVIGSTHEDGGLISDFGENYSPAEINYAERLIRRDQQLTGISLQQTLRLVRKIGVMPDPEEPASEPRAIQKKRVRDEIVRLVRAVAMRKNHSEPDFKGVQTALWKRMGVKNIDDLTDNYSIERMQQAVSILKSWMGGKSEAA